ncbi:N-acetylglucosaminyl transferase component Gpi1 [Aulographum hederae CBS 113979]|uniref:N-acetylglucosaminyl transferase component Gpi1 n=1 Tax=Aulographum hederae CBS 113979 TaxID=1176131 RepID=A0A6G1H4K5_9PEZI|nr:N-acetylglucosaminyl transferase component Gpi1 [Aulographum hederae CBS 113979]
MVTHNGLMRVFWPSDVAHSSHSGVLVGWRNSNLDVLVAAVLRDVEVRAVENALRVGTLFRGSKYPFVRILDRCGQSPLQVLGTVNPSNPPTAFNPNALVASTSSSSRQLQIFCPEGSGVMIQAVLFDRPDPTRMQYLSLDPIKLALVDKEEATSRGFPVGGPINAEEEQERQRKKVLVEKLKFHTVTRHVPTRKEVLLPTIIEQMNCCYEVSELLQKNAHLIGTRPKRALSVSERVVESASTVWQYIWVAIWQFLTVWVYPVMVQLFTLGLMGHRIAGEGLLILLDWRPLANSLALKDVSATAQQVDIRLQQFCYWPIQYITLNKRKNDWQSITNSHPEYIRFFNSLWLVANDVIIGIALGSYIIENHQYVASTVDEILNTYAIRALEQMLQWLMAWPAGLKLNTELSKFLGDLFLWVIEYWRDIMWTLRPFLPGVVYFIGFSSFAGATMPIALFSDLVSLLTLHIYSFYVASARIYHWQLSIIISLFHLFRGKKRNVLRFRIDSCDYDLDQLLIGTILFTVLFFLLPTVFVFYLTFASARMAIIVLKAGLDTLLACLNHFPLFAVMLRIKDSRRLPGGIRFELHDTQIHTASPSQPISTSIGPSTSYIYLRSIPLPLRAMFNEYFQLAARIRKHYVSPAVMLCLVTGKFVPPIHRKNLYSLQYSMLPARRASIAELWERITAAGEEGEGKGKSGGMNGHGHHGRKGSNGWNGRRTGGH